MGSVKGKGIVEGRDKERRGGKGREGGRKKEREDREKVEISLPQREGGG